VAALDAGADAPVVEIGPGTGALTGLLAETYSDFTAIEVDQRAVAELGERFPELDVRHQDVLDLDWEALFREKGRPLWVVGNLPYYITSPILFSLIAARARIARAVCMMQLEVAERIVAPHGSKTYGGLSVQCQLLSRPKLLFRVSRNVFYPKPDVESAVVAFDFIGTDELPVPEEALRLVVRTAFNQRRKMLRNSLRSLFADEAVEIPEELADRRPEALPPQAFVELTRLLQTE